MPARQRLGPVTSENATAQSLYYELVTIMALWEVGRRARRCLRMAFSGAYAYSAKTYAAKTLVFWRIL